MLSSVKGAELSAKIAQPSGSLQFSTEGEPYTRVTMI